MARETDNEALARLGTDSDAWAEEFLRQPPFKFVCVTPDHPYLITAKAWFQHAIDAGRRKGLVTAKAVARKPGDVIACNLPSDDRWFLAYQPSTGGRVPWTIVTRGDGGIFDEDGYPVEPARWEPLPDPQPPGSGWRWPEGTIEVCRAKINETRWSGWMAHIIKPDGTFDDREPYLSKLRAEVEAWASSFAAWSGLAVSINDAEFDNIVPFRNGEETSHG